MHKKLGSAGHTGVESAGIEKAPSKESCQQSDVDQGEEEGSIETCCVCDSAENVRRCGGCKATSYCSRECQKSHRAYHEPWCAVICQLEAYEKKKLYGDRSVRQCQVDWKTKKRIMKLVGTKPLLNCTLGKKEFKVLWDS